MNSPVLPSEHRNKVINDNLIFEREKFENYLQSDNFDSGWVYQQILKYQAALTSILNDYDCRWQFHLQFFAI